MPIQTDKPDIERFIDLANQNVSRKLFDIAFTTDAQKQALKEKELEWQKQAKRPKQTKRPTYAEKAERNTHERDILFKSFNGYHHEQDLWDGYRCLLNDETEIPQATATATAKSVLVKQAQNERSKTLDQIKSWLNANTQNRAPSVRPRKRNGNLLSENEQDVLRDIFASSHGESEEEYTSRTGKGFRKWKKPKKTKKKKLPKKHLFSLEDKNRFQALSDKEGEPEFPSEPVIREPESDSSSDTNSENNKAIKTKRRRKRRRTNFKNGKNGTCKECQGDCLTDETDTEFYKPKQISKMPPPVMNGSLSENEKETEPSNDELEEEPKVLQIDLNQLGDSFPEEPVWGNLTDLITESSLTDDTGIEFFKPKQMSKRPPPVMNDSLSENEKETEPSNDKLEGESKVLHINMNELDDSFPEEPDWGDLTDLITESEMETLPEILPIELDASTEVHVNNMVEPELSSYFNGDNTESVNDDSDCKNELMCEKGTYQTIKEDSAESHG